MRVRISTRTSLGCIISLSYIWRILTHTLDVLMRRRSSVTALTTLYRKIIIIWRNWTRGGIIYEHKGLYIFSDLKFTEHINNIASRALMLVRTWYWNGSFQAIGIPWWEHLLHNVRPIEIASPVWSPSAQRGWDNELEAAQRRFTERIRGLSDTAYSTRQLCTINY